MVSSINPDHFLRNLEFQLSQNFCVASYCEYCKWTAYQTSAKFCAYGHGELRDIQEYINQKDLEDL